MTRDDGHEASTASVASDHNLLPGALADIRGLGGPDACSDGSEDSYFLISRTLRISIFLAPTFHPRDGLVQSENR